MAVVYADLDGFKQINDVHGHAAGDQVLIATAARFSAVVRSNDTVVRREVVTGQVNDQGVAIIQGLNGDERVVQLAGAFLNPGQKVRPERAQPAR